MGALLLVPATASARVPDGFVGAMLDGPAAEFAPERLAHELDVMRVSGVETVRVAWYWNEIQPAAGEPLRLSRTDTLVGLAARRGLRILPVTLRTTAWNARALLVGGTPPRTVGPYARFMRALVERYGSRGTFWREHPGLPRRPIRWWQLWNEPHLRDYWASRRWIDEYAALVHAAARAIHRTDPRARVVLSGLTTDRLPLWDHLDELLAAGVGPDVDVVAAHVFTGRPENVVRALERVRETLSAYGLDRVPLALTEWSWPSSAPAGLTNRASWETTERGQAQRVARTLRLLARERARLRLRTAIHYTWLGRENGGRWSAWAGLRRLEAGGRVVSKPALSAFRRVARGL